MHLRRTRKPAQDSVPSHRTLAVKISYLSMSKNKQKPNSEQRNQGEKIMKPVVAIFVLGCAALVLAGDEWMITGKDIAYPQELYFVGIGMSERSQEAAKQNAVVEVRKQISVSVSASMLDEQYSLVSGGKESAGSRTESRARLSTSGEMQGIEVVKTGTKGKAFFALAVLDKKNFESNCRAAIAEARTELATLIEGAKADIAAAKTGAALTKLSAAKKAITKILDQRKLLSAVATVTDAEKLPYTQTDIALLYEQCVSGLRMVKSGGDNQSFAVGMVPAEPFSVTVTVQGAPAPGIPVNLLAAPNKTVLTRYTDDAGVATFILGENADMSAGSHSYTAAIALSVSDALKKVLAAQNQQFSYTVVSNPCFAKLVVDVSPNLAEGRDDIAKKIMARLSKYDIKDDPGADATLLINVSATETGNVQGLSENNTFIKTDVNLIMTLKDDAGKELGSLNAKGKGTGGNLIKSAVNGAENVKVEKDLKSLLEKICGGQSSGPKLRIAVFEFKQRSGYYSAWHDLAISLSDMMITKLINSGRLEVVERSQLNRIMEERALAQSGVVEEKEAITAAQLAGADIVLVGSAGIAGEKIEADARIIDLKSGIAKCAMNSASYSFSDLRAMADDLVSQIKSKCLK